MRARRLLALALASALACAGAAVSARAASLAETVKTRQRYFGAANVDPATGGVRRDRVILSWFGVTNFAMAIRGHVVLLDAWVPRGGTSGYVPSSPEELALLAPEAIFIGHAHFDHAADATPIALATGAPLVANAEQCADLQARAASAMPPRCIEALAPKLFIPSHHDDWAAGPTWIARASPPGAGAIHIARRGGGRATGGRRVFPDAREPGVSDAYGEGVVEAMVAVAPAVEEADGVCDRAVLRDGTNVVVRPLHRGEKDTIVRWFDGLGAETRYARFLGLFKDLDPELVARLAEVDHRDHEALVAIAPDRAPIGIARYIRLSDRDSAEVAVAIVDRWRGRGAARVLLARLSDHARAAGIHRFYATCLADNTAVIRALGRLGRTAVGAPSAGVVEVWIELDVPPVPRSR